jgi:hypothetical protein
MDRLRLSVLVTDVPVRWISRERLPRAAVDIQSSLGAPGDELLRVDASTVGSAALAAKLAFSLLGSTKPLVERPGEKLRVRHDLANPAIITASVPRDADADDLGRDVLEHGIASPAGVDSRRMTEGKGVGNGSLPGGPAR